MRSARARKGGSLEWWIAGLAAGGAALTASIQILQVMKAPTWLFVTLYILTGALGIAAALFGLRKKLNEQHQARVDKQRAWEQAVRSYLALGPGSSAALPKVSEVSPYQLGVSRSAYASDDAHRNDPYVRRREADGKLRESLSSTESRFVILVGDSKSGKSRTMYEAVNETLPESPLVVPVNGEAIGKLFSLDPPLDLHPKPGVLWLDDLDEARLGKLTPSLLDQLASEVVIVASMTYQRHNRITGSDSEIGYAARLALAGAETIHLDFELTDEERMEAEARYPEERFAHSIGEPLVAADQLTARFNAGRADNPAGYALVRAAIDWRRAGLSRPIRDSELRALYPEYLSSIRVGLEPSNDLYKDAVTWACEPLVSQVALLERVSGGAEHEFLAFDYLVALLDGQRSYSRRDILPAIWNFIIESLSEEEAVPSGYTAYLRNDLAIAERIWRTFASGSSTDSAIAAIDLGNLLDEQGDAEGARRLYQRAIDSNHPEAVALAARNLGEMLREQGDTEGARAAYQKAIDSNHPEHASVAALLLGLMLQDQGDTEGARSTLQRVVDLDDPGVTPMVWSLLGTLLDEQGDTEGARHLYQKAIDSGHPDAAPLAARNLGMMLQDQGDTEGARAAYQKAIDSGHPDAAPIAEDMLNDLNQ
jgi:tetratricopeptide (TPR) repeat protein